MTRRTLVRVQHFVAAAAVLLGCASAWSSWRSGSHHRLTVSLLVVVLATVSVALTSLVTQGTRDRAP